MQISRAGFAQDQTFLHGLPAISSIVNSLSDAHYYGVQEKESKMRMIAKNSRNFIGQTIAIFGAAASVSAAVRAHRKPAKSDLEALGIDAAAFDKVQL